MTWWTWVTTWMMEHPGEVVENIQAFSIKAIEAIGTYWN